MRARAVNLICTGRFESLDGIREGPSSVDQVINDQDVLASYFPDDVQHFSLVRTGPSFVDHDEVTRESLCIRPGHLDTPDIGRSDREVRDLLSLKMSDKYSGRVEVVERNIEKSLDLRRVQVHCDDTVGTCRGKQVRHKLGTDRDPWLVFPILSCVAKIGDDCGDTACRGTFGRINKDQELDEIFRRRVSRLDYEDIVPTNVLTVLYPDLAVTEALDLTRAERFPGFSGYFVS